MATTLSSFFSPSRRDTIYSLRSGTTDDLVEFKLSQSTPTRRPKTAGSSHYRPHSAVAAEPEHRYLSRTRSFYKPRPSSIIRPLSIMGFGAKKTISESPVISPPAPQTDRHNPTPGLLATSAKSKKKYPLSLLSASETTLNPRNSTPVGPIYQQQRRLSRSYGVPLIEKGDECTAKPSTDRLFWSQKNGQLLLHPFSSDGVPYMLAYDGVLIQSDHYTTSLLHRLNPNGSPSFHDYGKKPPGTVLDLGCGDMFWAEKAAMYWKAHKTQITAFDLINAPAMLRKSDHPIPDNVQFVQGDFINHPLPFHDNTFDMVRMACLTLAIPYQKWKPVLIEVLRVLKPGGRVEIIDDQMIFPYGFNPSSGQGNRCSLSSESSVILSGEGRPSSSARESVSSQLSTQHLSSSRPIPIPSARTSTILGIAPPPDDWDVDANLSRDLECIFNAMLVDEFGIHPQPHEFIPQVLGDIFGKARTSEVCAMHLKLAPTSEASRDTDRFSMASSDSGYFSSSSVKNRWFGPKDDDFYKGQRMDEPMSLSEQSPMTSNEKALPPLPTGLGSINSRPVSYYRTPSIDSIQSTDRISAKAADRLGIDIKTLTEATSAIAKRRRLESLSEPAQSPGLILCPGTFIPFEPAELEMHVCKHMHTLLGCKSALTDYFLRQADGQGRRFAKRDELDEALWTYECFRRARFNWPQNLLQEDDPVVFKQSQSYNPAPSLSSRLRSGSGTRQPLPTWRSVSPQDLTHVRSFRVFEAVKMPK